jgi:hypothetical protein
MDDLKMLGALLATPDPSRDAFERGRRQLRETIRGPVRRHRARWLGAGLSLTAAAAAAVVVVASVTSAPAPHHPPAAVTQSGQQILLAAATSAEQASEGSGAYWHIKTVITDFPGDQYETWTKRDGESWTRDMKTNGKVVKDPFPDPPGWLPGNFSVGGDHVSFEQLSQLPTGTAALKAWILTNAIKPSQMSGPTSDPAFRRSVLIYSLIGLISELPVSRKVRAAAFRVLASLPGIRSIGRVNGGQGLLISVDQSQQRLVVDPATARVRNSSMVVPSSGGAAGLSAGTATVTAEWTNQPPK